MPLSAFATGSVTLAWNASTDPSVAGYNVYYGGASGAYTNEISVGNATNATISGLVQGTTYYFAATTYAASGMESPFSSEVSYLVPMNVPIVNQPPTLNAINNLAMNENAGLQTVSLSGITSGAINDRLLEGCKGILYLLAAGCRPDPAMRDWEACRHPVKAAILAASQCGFQPRVPKADTVSNCAPTIPTRLFHLEIFARGAVGQIKILPGGF